MIAVAVATGAVCLFIGYLWGANDRKVDTRVLTDLLRDILQEAIEQAKHRKV